MRITTGPVILIVVGIVLLLSNLNMLPLGQLKALAATWWPLALIVAGVIQLRKR